MNGKYTAHNTQMVSYTAYGVVHAFVVFFQLRSSRTLNKECSGGSVGIIVWHVGDVWRGGQMVRSPQWEAANLGRTKWEGDGWIPDEFASQ